MSEGSAQLVTDYQGETYEQLEYTPYGELWVEHVPITGETPFRFTGKERDGETGLYYFGARYLNPQTSMWLSADPAMGEYVPQAPINDEAKKHNENLPGMGGVFNYVNLHVYHYAGNNPVKLTDPDGLDIHSLTDGQWIQVKDALDQAVNDLDVIISELQDFNDGKLDKLSPKIISGTGKYMDADINNTADMNVLITFLSKIRNGLSTLERDDFRYDDFVYHVTNFGTTVSFVDDQARNKIFAYTIPVFKKIYLGDKFFNAGTRGIDTKQGILIHERSHNWLILATNDSAYGPSKAKNLSGFDRMRNADNYEFFYEHVMTGGY